MATFVKDLTLHVRTPEVTTSIQAPPDVTLGRLLDDLRAPLHLSSSLRWQVHDREGRRLDHSRTLVENGLREGDEIEIREQKEAVRIPDSSSPAPSPTPRPSPGRTDNVLKRCDNGHYYDLKKYRECPYCEARKGK